jgi:hypothetical protein
MPNSSQAYSINGRRTVSTFGPSHAFPIASPPMNATSTAITA